MSGHLKPLNLRFLTEFTSFRITPLCLFHAELNSFNPSIAAHNGEIYFSLRHSNMLAAGSMRHYRTFNKTLTWNAAHPRDETSFGTLQVGGPGERVRFTLFDSRVADFEDLRIFRHLGRWFALGSRMTGDIVRGTHNNSMHLLIFSDRFQLERSVALPSPTGSRTEKNWVPLSKGSALFVVYHPAPLDVFALDPDNGQMVPVIRGKQPSSDWSHDSQGQWAGLGSIPWSGSSQFVACDAETYIGAVHRKFVFADELIYEHAFMKIGPNFDFVLSKPFHFLTYGIEMCIGLALRGDDLLMSVGSYNDTRAHLCAVSKSDVDSLFFG
jgi:hypothetical protein